MRRVSNTCLITSHLRLPQARTIGVGPADRQLQLARMATAEEAKALGLVDQVTTSEQLLPMARDTMAAAMNLPDFGRHVTKERLHGDFARAWEAQVPLIPHLVPPFTERCIRFTQAQDGDSRLSKINGRGKHHTSVQHNKPSDIAERGDLGEQV